VTYDNTGQQEFLFRYHILVHQHKIDEYFIISRSRRPDSEAPGMSGGRYVRRMGVEVVQEGKERAIHPPPAQPIEECVVDCTRTARLEADPLFFVIIAETDDVLECPLAGNRATHDRQRC
jgi:hypothetical protein